MRPTQFGWLQWLLANCSCYTPCSSLYQPLSTATCCHCSATCTATCAAADHELDETLALIKDSSLRDTLQFGIGLHHAGLAESDREVVESLYVGGKIQVGEPAPGLAWPGLARPADI